MNHLTRNDFFNALQLLARVEAHAENEKCFAHAVVSELGDYVASELTLLLVCDLHTRQGQVVALHGLRLSADQLECFGRHLSEYPLAYDPGKKGDAQTHRNVELVIRHAFPGKALHGDFCRRIRREYMIALPLFSDRRALVHVALNRCGFDFSERDCQRLELVRPHLAFLYHHARQGVASAPGDLVPTHPVSELAMSPPGLTTREADVMFWLACGKTDVEIAAQLSISPRTVQKHLEHIYVKLGVETRTAAVMRSSMSSMLKNGA